MAAAWKETTTAAREPPTFATARSDLRYIYEQATALKKEIGELDRLTEKTFNAAKESTDKNFVAKATKQIRALSVAIGKAELAMDSIKAEADDAMGWFE